jgi:hypothetical protein
MKTSTTQTGNIRPAISKITIALVFASVTSGLGIGPVLAEDNNHKRDEHHDNGMHKSESHVDRDRHEYQHERHEYQQPHYYSRPVYAPPPVYYVPYQSPGISVFLPLDIHIH